MLVLSAYDATSHRLWRERLETLFQEYSWTQLSLPPRHFDWRLRSNSLHWGLEDIPELESDYDLLLATSMVDLAALRGLRPQLARIPTVVYFHENQFFYPDNADPAASRRTNVEPLLVPVYSALCADAIVFNSRFNRDSFLQGVRSLFARLPDSLPERGWKRLRSSAVIAVPVSSTVPEAPIPRAPGEALELLWNHRWEYDKGPALLLAVVRELHTRELAVRLHLVGQQFRQQPEEFAQIQTLAREICAAHQLPHGTAGFVAHPSDYQQLMRRCDVVLSTADHEFQGLGIQEACLLGCSPLTPDDLAYPEYLPQSCRYPRLESVEATAAEVVNRLRDLLARKQQGQPLPAPDLAPYCGPFIREQYLALFSRLLTSRPGAVADSQAQS